MRFSNLHQSRQRPSYNTVGRCSRSIEPTVGKNWWEKGKDFFKDQVQDTVDFLNPVKQAKIWKNFVMDTAEWVKKVKKYGKKDPSLILNPPLLKTGFKPLDKKILKYIEKKKHELDKWVIDTTVMKPLGLETMKIEEQNGKKEKEARKLDKKSQEELSRYKKDNKLFEKILHDIKDDTALFENKCRYGSKLVTKYRVGKQNFTACRFAEEVKPKAEVVKPKPELSSWEKRMNLFRGKSFVAKGFGRPMKKRIR